MVWCIFEQLLIHIFGLGFFGKWHINLYGLYNDKAILVEEH